MAIRNLVRGGNGRRKAGLNRTIADAGWGGFLRVLSWQAAEAGKQLVVFPASGTTQQCSVLARDRNAAWNLHPDRPRNNRLGCTGGGDDGNKTQVPAGTWAA